MSEKYFSKYTRVGKYKGEISNRLVDTDHDSTSFKCPTCASTDITRATASSLSWTCVNSHSWDAPHFKKYIRKINW